MLNDASDIDGQNTQDGVQKPGKKVRLLTLDDLDKRTQAAKVACSTRDQICTDLGGTHCLSTLELLQVDSVAITAAMLADLRTRWLRGEDVDMAMVATLQNVFNRTASTLGLKRRSQNMMRERSLW